MRGRRTIRFDAGQTFRVPRICSMPRIALKGGLGKII
jgi:hypothetical protein